MSHHNIHPECCSCTPPSLCDSETYKLSSPSSQSRWRTSEASEDRHTIWQTCLFSPAPSSSPPQFSLKTQPRSARNTCSSARSGTWHTIRHLRSRPCQKQYTTAINACAAGGSSNPVEARRGLETIVPHEPQPLAANASLQPRHFINLTNGIEALSDIASLVPSSDVRFTRIQSSHCESGAYDKLLLSLDTELVFSLACGRSCFLYDFGSRNKLRGVPRALFLGVEFIKWSLAYLWFDVDQPEWVPNKVLVRGRNTVPYWRDAVMPYRISKDAKKKLRYFAPFAKEIGVKAIRLFGVYGRVSDIDGCKDVHVKLVRDWLDIESQRSGHTGDTDCDDSVREWLRGQRYAEYNADSSAQELVAIQEWIRARSEERET